MNRLTDHPDRGGRTTHSSRLDRLSVVAGLVMLLCLIPGLAARSQDVSTTTEVTFGLTIGGTFTPLSSLPSDPVVGQEVTVVWKVTAQTDSDVTWDDSLSRKLKSPGSPTWDLLDDTVAPGDGENDENWIKWTYKFTPEVAGTYTAEGSYPDCDDCAPPLEASSSGSETASVDKANTTTSLSLDPASSVTGQSVTLTATVAPSIPSPVGSPPAPTGTVAFSVGATLLGSAGLDPVTGEAEIATSSIPVGTQTITAQYEGDDCYNASSGTEDETVDKADTALTLATAPSPSGAGQPVTLTADVATESPGGGSPTGTVTFTVGATFLGSAGLVSTGADASQAEITTSLIPAGAQTVTAEYGGDTDYNGDDDTEDHTVIKSNTTTIVSGSDTPLVVGDTVTCTVTVEGTSLDDTSMPIGDVTVTVNPVGQGSPNSWSHTLVASDAGQFTFTYTPESAASTSHTFTATYAGDDAHGGSSGSFAQAIIKRAVDVWLSCSPTAAYIFQDVECHVYVEDDTTAGTPVMATGTVTFSDGGKNGIFTVGGVPAVDDTWPLGVAGDCAVTYTPGAFDAGTTAITATYNGSSAHSVKSTTELLAVDLRPTQTQVLGSMDTLLVNEVFTGGTVEVTDIAGVGTSTPPFGTLAYSSSLAGDATITLALIPPPPAGDGFAPEDEFAYQCHALNAAAGFDTIRVDYTANDGIHANSAGAFGQGVQRRPTVTTLSSCASTADGCTCDATVAEHPDCSGHGSASPIGGTLASLGPDTDITGSAPDWEVTTHTDAFVAVVSVGFTADDRVHLDSTAVESVSRSDQFPPEPDDGSTGAGCDDGCGSGGRNVDEILMGINIAELTLTAVQMSMEIFATVLDVIPDVVTGGGVFVIVGVTIPISDIIAAVIAGAGIAIDIAVTTMTTDIDGDGLPGVVEATLGTSDSKVDTDGDGMGDADEISEAGGWCGGSRRPNPLVPDSDGDGLLDGDEGSYGTSVCVADTDCDGVSDGVEVGTWDFTEIRNHSDPLMQDTDGDGLRDDLEIDAGCPYVSDDDSDDDGLQDGYEDSNRDGTISNAIGTSLTQGSGETDFCRADTDGDGLLDGQEEGIFGTSVTPKGVSASVGTQGGNLGVTVPALDSDMDNDGLSDAAETSIYQTDPMDADTDNDMISDGAEVATWANADARNHSNPREADTDGDGLTDNLEIALGCPYVNDDDSDEDGLQDGYEDTNRNGTIANTLGSTGTQGSGETDFCDADSDNDGLLDGEEEALFGQGERSATTPTGTRTTVPALDDDTDDDGLSDYEEVHVTHTDPLDWDTDDDSLADVNELLATAGATWPKRTLRQVSDPLDPDTDDDGLPDAVEYTGTGLDPLAHGTGGSDDLTCTYVNDADSDNDGLQDGAEDANHDGEWSGITLGSFNTQAVRAGDYWETDPCNPDTDGDGLGDGEEATLLGGGPISQRPATGWPSAETAPGFDTVTPEGTSTVVPVGPNCTASPMYTFTPTPGNAIDITVPALDTDSDNDGLSDYEEVNTTGTNPLDADSDNDTIADADELVATGGAWPQRTFDQESDPLDINTDDDYLFDPVEGECGAPVYTGTGLSTTYAGVLGGDRDTACPYVDNADSDDDGVVDGAVIALAPHGVTDGDGVALQYTHCEGFTDVAPAGPDSPGVPRVVPEAGDGESYDDLVCNVCDADSDGDGLTDGEEVGIGTNPGDWDTDNDGRSDWHEHTGGGPIPTDPFDPDTDDDGLLDSVEVFGLNPTNPANADTDGDGLCDGGAGTPWMISGDARVVVNPLCKSCSSPGLDSCGGSCCTGGVRTGSAGGIGDHPNPSGYGEDKDGDGSWDPGGNNYWGNVYAGGDETDPNQYDTDGDGDGDGIEVLAFSTSRQNTIPTTDTLGRPITVTYPSCGCEGGCLDPLNPDSDGDGLSDGYEDANHDGNFDFLPSDFDIDTSSVETLLPDPEETNPCDPDTDHDDLTDYEERYQAQTFEFYANWDNDGDGEYNEDPFVDGIDEDGDGLDGEDPVETPFNATNPLDFDTDNDWLTDGEEVKWDCVAIEYTTLDNDTDGLIDEDPIDGVDNDEDGLLDEDPVDFWVRSIPMLDPTMRDSDSDGYIDGLDEDPCNSELIPTVEILVLEPVDSDGDGFSDDDEIAAGTHPNGPEDHPVAYCAVDVDFDDAIDDRIWLEPGACCGEAGSVVFDLDANVLIDLRVAITSKSIARGDFDKDGYEDDVRYTVEYILSNYRAVQLHGVATIDDFNCDLVIDWVIVQKK